MARVGWVAALLAVVAVEVAAATASREVTLDTVGGEVGSLADEITTTTATTTATAPTTTTAETTTTPAAPDSTAAPPPSTPAPPASTAPTATPPPPPPASGVRLTEVARLDQPIAMATRPGDGAIYVAERVGRVRRITGGRVEPAAVADITSQVLSGGERGLLGIAFSADGRRLYLSYTNREGDTRIDEVSLTSAGAVVGGSRRTVLAVDQPFSNHNGGDIHVGPDGMLWIALGDGGSGGDPQGNGQNPATLLGSLLRIDPTRGDPYAIPAGNPFAGGGGRAEVYSYGLRNPWRFSFDRATGDVWIADVGQGAIEEVNRRGRQAAAGANFGWNRLEGTRRYSGSPPAGHVPPVFEYARSGGNCAVTGGYVYRGSRIPSLVGDYVFADFCVSQVRALDLSGGVSSRSLGVASSQIASFGEDQAGELYVLSLGGGVFRLDPG